MKKPYFIVALMLLVCLAMSACGSKAGENAQIHSSADVSAYSGISGDVREYGLLISYDAKSRELNYEPIEIVEASDTDRIKELEEQGVALEFPNGYFVYQPNKTQLRVPVDESVSVSLLNEAFSLEKSSMDAVADRLEGHPLFFLCRLHTAKGKITSIEERFVP